MRLQFGLMALCGVALSANAQTFLYPEDYLSTYNLITFGDLTTTSEVEGRTLVGGNLNTSSSNFGVEFGNATGIDILTVAGNINGNSIQVNNGGNLRIGGASFATVNLNGGGQQINDNSVGSFVNDVQVAMTGYSSFLTGLASTASVSLPGNNDQPTGVTFNAAPAGPNNVAVFDIAGNDLFNNNKVQQIGLNFNGADTVVINVSGSSIVYNGGNFVGSFASDNAASKVIWNFFEADTIQLDRVLWGSVLAPGAAITGIGGNPTNQVIEGSVVANSLLTNSEIHLPTFTGFVPAPSTAGALAFGGLLAARRRRA